MADNSYISSGNNAELVRAVKDYAVFLFGEGETYTKPAGADWTPPANKLPIGYNSEDGTTIHPEPGDETEIKGHNGDVVYSETDPGYWTFRFSALEGKKSVVELYTNSTVGKDGGIHVKDASTSKTMSMVIAGIDQKGRPIVIYAEKIKVSDRDDITLKSTDLLQYNMTLKTFKGSDGCQWHAWGMVVESSASTAAHDATAEAAAEA